MAKQRPTRRQLIGINLATGEEQYADVADWGDVVGLFDDGETEQLRTLFDEGMTFEEFDRDYCNAKEANDYVVTAAKMGNTELVKLLVEQGADPDQWEDGSGDTAFVMAVVNKDRDLLEYLVTVIKSDEDRQHGQELLQKWKKTKKK